MGGFIPVLGVSWVNTASISNIDCVNKALSRFRFIAPHSLALVKLNKRCCSAFLGQNRRFTPRMGYATLNIDAMGSLRPPCEMHNFPHCNYSFEIKNLPITPIVPA